MKFKEKDIRDLDVLKQYLALVEKDSRKILEKKNSLEIVDQTTWGLGESVFEFEKNGYRYERCLDTGSLFVNPRPYFDILMDFYSLSDSSVYWVEEFFMPKIDIRRDKIFKPRAEYLTKKFGKKLLKMKIGDIGAGFGIFIEELRKINNDQMKIEAIEPSKNMANICRDKGIAVNENMLENINKESKKYDLLTTFELFEHLHDPSIFLNQCYELLNPGGYIYITTLNSHGFDIQVLWESSNSVSPPHHLNFFNPISMKNILSISGFENIQISTPGELDVDIVQNNYLNSNLSLPRFLKTIYDNYPDQVLNNFQKFLKENSLSSHMRAIAQKPNK